MFTLIEHKYKELFWKSHVDKQLKIATDDGKFTATNPDINWENFELTESLCSESELRFGSCEPGMVKFQIRNAFIPLAGKWITITETLDGNADVPFRYGRYKVFSDVPTADKEYRDITAYDAMYDIIDTDVAAWYNTLLPSENSTVTMKHFRESFVRYFGLEDDVPADGLINDNMTVERTIEPDEISGKDVITAICEINGCFGHIGRNGKFHYIYLPQDIQGLYPANSLYPNHAPNYLPYQQETGSLYPQGPKGERFGSGRYISCKYEDYIVYHINKIQIRKEENDIGAIYPKTEPSEKDNTYIIEDNFIVYGKSTEELDAIAENIYKKITRIVYRPYSAECPGNPCFEVGDPVRFSTKYNLVETYILKRTLKGIQGLRDIYSADGKEKYSKKVNGIQKSIIQLKGKSNVLERTVEENRIKMLDIAGGLSNEISITASGLQADIEKEVKRATGEEDKISTSIKAIAGEIVLKVDANGKMTLVELRADPDTGSEFKVNSGNISLTAEDVISLMSGGTLNLTGKNIEIRSDNFNVDSYGNMQCHNITAFSISGDAVNQFNSVVEDTKALKVANESLEAIKKVIYDLNTTIIPEINGKINELQVDVANLDGRISALESTGGKTV